jgi:hypothetical protein
MKRLIHSPRPCSPRLNLETIQPLRITSQPPAFIRANSDSRLSQNFDSRKKAQTDTQHLDRQSTEYTASGTDSSVADRGDVSFDPAKSLDPQQARELAGKGTAAANPLEVSPANPAVSSTSREVEGGRDSWSQKSETRGFFGEKAKATDGKVGEQHKRVFKGFDRRKEGQTPRYIKPGSR